MTVPPETPPPAQPNKDIDPTPGGTQYQVPTTGPDANDPIPSGSYPPPGNPYATTGPTPAGYPFPVQGPTAPDASSPGPPVELEPPPTRYYDPTYNGPPPFHPRMPRDPFGTLANDQESEFGFGEGMYPDPILDYSRGGGRSRFPLADPDPIAQRRNLAAIRRTDVSSPYAAADPYVPGNPDRFGAAPPLVRKRGRYKPSHYKPPRPPRMQREW